eukprot:m.404513 g.404513  ORF g.404513 m.404513 type:complete len:129 (-) comp21198_c0_seq1:2763-3149(-)
MSVHGRDVLASTGVAINGCDVLPFKDGVIRAAYRSARVTGASSSPLPPTEPECLARRAPAQPKRHQPEQRIVQQHAMKHENNQDHLTAWCHVYSSYMADTSLRKVAQCGREVGFTMIFEKFRIEKVQH